MSKRWLIALVAALSLILAACANDAEGGEETTTTVSSETTTTADSGETTTTADGGGMESPYEHLNAAYAGEYEGTTVNVAAQWVDAEEENILSVLTPFEEATGITINYEGISDYETVLTVRVEGNDAPDIAQTAQPGKIARGYNHATAFEWALKLQELTYAVAQPFSTADFLHGPIAVLEKGYPVLAIASTGPTLDDVRDVIARSVDAGAKVMIITDDESTAGLSETSIVIPTGGNPEWLSPIPFVAACQLFAYHLTLAKGLDVETPRGLKKVTRTL